LAHVWDQFLKYFAPVKLKYYPLQVIFHSNVQRFKENPIFWSTNEVLGCVPILIMYYVYRGRMCQIPELKKKAPASIKKLRENSFQVQGPKLFNSLPIKIRNLRNCSVDQFKAELDMMLEKIPDEPNVTGSNYTPSACDLYTGKPSNSIVDQIRSVNFSSKNQVRRMGQ
jgi:hypothetical protein